MKKILLACIAVSAALALTASANDSRYRTYVPGIIAANFSPFGTTSIFPYPAALPIS